MVYHQAVMLLCCPFISHYYKPEKEGDAAQQLAEVDDNSPESIRLHKALSSCSSSVRSVCIIAQKYRQVFGSFKLSPMTATHCTLSTALIIIELCCAGKPSPKHYPPDDGSYNLSPHSAVALCFQVLRELSTSWDIAKRIGRNLEKVYFDRYGNEFLPAFPSDQSDICKTACKIPETTGSWEAAVPNLEIFDDILTAKSVLAENPLSLSLNQNPNLSRAGIPNLATNPLESVQDFSNSDELFANNLGFAFTPDCLPSDYNMFDTLNHMYLEERWY